MSGRGRRGRGRQQQPAAKAAAAAAANNNAANNNNNAAKAAAIQWLANHLANVPANFAPPANRATAQLNDAERVAQLNQLAKLNLHGYGLVVREVPTMALRCVYASLEWTNAQWRAALWAYERAARGAGAVPAELKSALAVDDIKGAAKTVYKHMRAAHMVRAVLSDAVKDGGLCGPPLQSTFAQQYGLGWARPDGKTFVAFKLVKEGGQLKFKAVALGAYATSQEEFGVYDDTLRTFHSRSRIDSEAFRQYKMKFDKPDQDQWLRQGRVAEIDLMCSTQPGAGSALLSYILARIAARKKNGARRYKGVITYLAGHRRSMNRPSGNVYPFYPAITAMGFTQARVKLTREGVLNRERTEPYFVAFDNSPVADESWVARVVRRLQSLDVDQALLSCPTVPKSGRTYCA